MSESFQQTVERAEHQPALPTPEQAEPLRPGEKAPETGPQTAQEARTAVHELYQSQPSPNPLEKLQAEERAAEPAPRLDVTHELKKITRERELRNLQRREAAPVRTFSKLVHQPVVRVLSEAASTTISRPSGLLGGGIVALIGTTAYLYLARHVGFTYNYLIFLLLFVGGFALGLLLEATLWLVRSRQVKVD